MIWLRRVSGWFRRHPLYLAIAGYGLLEGWFALRRLLRVAIVDPTLRSMVLALVLAGIIGMLVVVLFGGRTREGRVETLKKLGMVSLSAVPALILFCYGYALIIERSGYLTGHTMWTTVRPDADLVIYPRANLNQHRTYFAEEDRFVPISTDERGFRNDFDVQAAPIAVLGDSFIFGMWVPNEQLWNADLWQEAGIRAANYGVFSYDLWQYNELAERFGNEHDVVVYALFVNDLTNNDRSALKPSRNQIARQLWPWQNPANFTINRFLIETSPLGRLFDSLRLGRLLTAEPDVSPTDDDTLNSQTLTDLPELPVGLSPTCWNDAGDYDPDANDVLFGELDRAIELARSGGYQLVVVTIPDKEMVYTDSLLPYCNESVQTSVAHAEAGYAAICAYLTARNVPCHDLTEDFQQAANGQPLLYYSGDGHWNRQGHRVFADLLADALISDSLLQGQP